MPTLETLNDVQLVVLAVQYISDGDLDSLAAIAAEKKNTFDSELLYRLLLTFYPPNDATLTSLSAFLRLVDTDFYNYSPLDKPLDLNPVLKFSTKDAMKWSARLVLESLGRPEEGQKEDGLTMFIIAWLHKIEITEGVLQRWLPLVETFMSQSPLLQLWFGTYVVPVVRLQFDFYPDQVDGLGLTDFENMSGESGIDRLLTPALQSMNPQNISRDLNHIVTPWIRGSSEAKRRKLNVGLTSSARQPAATWNDVNEWLFRKSFTNFREIAETTLQWSDPDEESGPMSESTTDAAAYVQTLLAMIYAQNEASEAGISYASRLLQHAAKLASIRVDGSTFDLVDVPVVDRLSSEASAANFLDNALRNADNPLTAANETSMAFLFAVTQTAEILQRYKINVAIPQIARTCLFGSTAQQYQELARVLAQIPLLTTSNPDWQSIRSQLLWLRSWTTPLSSQPEQVTQPTFLARVEYLSLEGMILDAILATGQYQYVDQIYVDSSNPPLSHTVVEKRVVQAIFSAYDNATNGNRTRGGVKKASEMLQIFRTKFPNSTSLAEIDHLIRATHSLSFYQLTLEHGVPFQPVNIRVHSDPLDLIAKVLDQDNRAYTKVDDLLQIGRHLVQAGVPSNLDRSNDIDSVEKRLFDADHRITYLAINASLVANDFNTAYSYITTRLSTSTSHISGFAFIDDISWRAAYLAGKCRPLTVPKSLHARITDLSKRMDLLSLALTVAPNPESLPEILGTWRRCEEEMDSLKSQALEEERAFDLKGSEDVPGGFGPNDRELDAAETKKALARRSIAQQGVSYEEAAPVGLFEVARGAASAFRKSAFPLGGARGDRLRIAEESGGARSVIEGDEPASPTYSNEARTRKRDMVSSVVKGGLGWVLGVQQAEPDERNDHR